MNLALAGCPNSGKSTLFNALTGGREHTGNFPGVTVERKSGRLPGTGSTLTDLPGIYSLRTYTPEEAVARDFLCGGGCDGIISVIDASCPARGLYLTLQLLDTGLPAVIVLSMTDLAGVSADTGALAASLGIPVFRGVLKPGEGAENLSREVIRELRRGAAPVRGIPGGELGRCIDDIEKLLAADCRGCGSICRDGCGDGCKSTRKIEYGSPRFGAVRLLEGETGFLRGADGLAAAVERRIAAAERKLGLDRHAALAAARYDFIDGICRRAFQNSAAGYPDTHTSAHRADRIVLGRFTSYAVLAAVAAAVFYLTFGIAGNIVSPFLARAVSALSVGAASLLGRWGAPVLLTDLICGGILPGVGSVLCYMPVILTLFFCLSLLEDSGYMARAAFIADRPLRFLGLSGRSFVPMLMGFGCTVPAVMATRTLTPERQRVLTVLLLPYMSCSAKIPVYAVFCAALFPGHAAAVTAALYLGGILLAAAASCLMRLALPRRGAGCETFLLELPPYRMPRLRPVAAVMAHRTGDFLRRAFTVILLASAAVWFLGSFTPSLEYASSAADSMLARFGSLLSPLFRPLGFGDSGAVSALIAGVFAKEAVISTLSVLSGSGSLPSLFTPAAAAAYLTFILLYTPCAASVAAMSRELHSPVRALGAALFQCTVAYFAALAVYTAACFIF